MSFSQTPCRAGTCPKPRAGTTDCVHTCLFRLPLRGRRGDACERRLWRRKRARRSGRIKATDTENRLKYSFQSVFNAVPALHFRDDKVSIAKIRLVPITVSQLKCALHILIGDWYDKWALPTQTEPLIQQDMSPPYRGCFVYRGAFFACELRDPNGVVAAQPFAPEERYGCGVPLAGIAGAISCRNYRLRINLFVCTVCRLRGRHAQWSCPTNMERTLAVGRDDSARRCRNYRLRINHSPATTGNRVGG